MSVGEEVTRIVINRDLAEMIHEELSGRTVVNDAGERSSIDMDMLLRGGFFFAVRFEFCEHLSTDYQIESLHPRDITRVDACRLIH